MLEIQLTVLNASDKEDTMTLMDATTLLLLQMMSIQVLSLIVSIKIFNLKTLLISFTGIITKTHQHKLIPSLFKNK